MSIEPLFQEWLTSVETHAQGQTVETIDEIQDLRTAEILEYVKSNSPFYSKHLLNMNGDNSVFKLLNGVPYTTKSDLRKVGTAVCSMPFNRIATYYETTGTTGKSTPCPRAAIDIETSGQYVQQAIQKIYQSTFNTLEVLTAIMGPSELYAFGDTYGEICRNLDIPFIRLWPESPRVGLEKAADLIFKLEVGSLICSPAIALALARFYISRGIEPTSTSVRQILLLGELCTPEMILNISNIWGAHCTHGLYGSQETHAVATGCTHGNLHLSETNYLFEILPIEGMQSDIGELCLTMLVPGAKPLIRFRTGDLATICQSNICECGSESRLIRVLGRVDDLMQIGNKHILPANIESNILKVSDRVWSYQVDVKLQKDGKEQLEIALIADMHQESISKAQVFLTEQFSVPVKITLTSELDSRTESGAYISWKHARIRDWRS